MKPSAVTRRNPTKPLCWGPEMLLFWNGRETSPDESVVPVWIGAAQSGSTVLHNITEAPAMGIPPRYFLTQKWYASLADTGVGQTTWPTHDQSRVHVDVHEASAVWNAPNRPPVPPSGSHEYAGSSPLASSHESWQSTVSH